MQVVLVRWNEPFQKLATCDMEGGIFVWIQYEGRWSVELVNDRGAQVVCCITVLLNFRHHDYMSMASLYTIKSGLEYINAFWCLLGK